MAVHHISENAYLQYFIGEKEYTSKCPFTAVSMTRFQKRISVEDIQEIIEMTIPQKKKTSEKKDEKTNTKNTDDNPSNGTDADTRGSDS